jgi:hypothetical protein
MKDEAWIRSKMLEAEEIAAETRRMTLIAAREDETSRPTFRKRVFTVDECLNLSNRVKKREWDNTESFFP